MVAMFVAGTLRRVIRILLCGVLMASVGCDRAWPAYQQIELGKPLANESLLVAEGRTTELISAWDDYAIVHVPALMWSWSLRAVVDDKGNVVGKYYHANEAAHWLIFRTAKWRWVMEVQVPKEAFRDPPPGWFPIFLLHGQTRPRTNVADYLLSVYELSEEAWGKTEVLKGRWWLDRLTFGIFFWWGFGPWAHGGDPELLEVAVIRDIFSGVTRDGYDRLFRNADGGTCRIRNLGERRILIESNYWGIFDTIRRVNWKKMPHVDVVISRPASISPPPSRQGNPGPSGNAVAPAVQNPPPPPMDKPKLPPVEY